MLCSHTRAHVHACTRARTHANACAHARARAYGRDVQACRRAGVRACRRASLQAHAEKPTNLRLHSQSSHGSQILSPILVTAFRTPRRPCNPTPSCTITRISHTPRMPTCMSMRDCGCPDPGNCATVTNNYPIPSRLPGPSPMVIEDFGRSRWGGLLGNCAFIKNIIDINTITQ